MTKQDAYAIQHSIWTHIRKVDCYQAWGYDWPTMRLTRPRVARVLAECYRVLDVPDSGQRQGAAYRDARQY